MVEERSMAADFEKGKQKLQEPHDGASSFWQTNSACVLNAFYKAINGEQVS